MSKSAGFFSHRRKRLYMEKLIISHIQKKKETVLVSFFLFGQSALRQLVVPSAVTIAVAIAAIICTMNLTVSFLVIIVNV